MQRQVLVLLGLVWMAPVLAPAAPRKGHLVVLGAARKVAYSRVGDPAGAGAEEKELKVRALIVDGVLREWTTGEAHDVTDRSFVVRRALRINDSLPGDALPGDTLPGAAQAGDRQARWVWQRGSWLVVDRVTGRIAALKLPDYDPGVSQVAWFRDYAAYCGVTASGKSLYAMVWQVGGRKPVLARKLAGLEPEPHDAAVCGPVEWQREPMKVTFHPAGGEAVGYEIVPGSAVPPAVGQTPSAPPL